MTIAFRFILVTVVALMVGSSLGIALPHARAATDPDVVPGSYIVVYRDDIVAASAVTQLYDDQSGVHVTHVYGYALNGFSAKLSPKKVAQLQLDPRVATVIPDRKMYPFGQTLPHGADRVDADLNPIATIDGKDDRVDADIAILDMGVGPNSDLNVVGGTDCTGLGTTLDDGGHGTHVAGIAAAKDNTTGIVGVAPGARIWSVKVLDEFDGNWSWVICGIDWVTEHADTIDVANMSLGEDIGPANKVFDEPMHDAIKKSVAAGVTYVVAAGNGAGDASTVIPATYNEVITVSALADSDGKPGGLGPDTSAGKDDHLATFSDYGADVDIAAPGVDTYSTAPGGGYSTMSGTSFATPHVTGAVALYIAQHGRVGPSAVKKALLATADPGPIPGDPDNYPEGVLNVGRFGGGKLTLSATTGKPGDTFTATLASFPKYSPVTLAWDGTTAGTATTDASGAATSQLTVPAIAKGAHVLTATAGVSYGAVSFTVKPVLRLDEAGGPVGTQLKVVLRGLGSREMIDILWANGPSTTTLATVTASSSGNVNASIRIPASTGSSHVLMADGRSGSLVKLTFTVMPTLTRSPSSRAPGGSVNLGLRGFQSSESVTISLVTGASTKKLVTTTVSSASGSRDIAVTIPAGTSAGTTTIRATGSRGTTVYVSLTVLPAPAGASAATPSPTATSIPTATSTVTATDTATVPGVTPTDIAEPSIAATQPAEATESPTGEAVASPVA